MEWHTGMRQLVLFAHLLAFALAIADVLREDWQLLVARELDHRRLGATARRLAWSLAVLWATGLALIALDVGVSWRVVAGNPKLVAKLLVVCILTFNGFLLHRLAFPLLQAGAPSANRAAALASLLGAVSTVSWLFASFTGASRIVAPYLRLHQFIGLYAISLGVGVAVALALVRRRLQNMLIADGLPQGAPRRAASEAGGRMIAAARAVGDVVVARCMAPGQLKFIARPLLRLT